MVTVVATAMVDTGLVVCVFGNQAVAADRVIPSIRAAVCPSPSRSAPETTMISLSILNGIHRFTNAASFVFIRSARVLDVIPSLGQRVKSSSVVISADSIFDLENTLCRFGTSIVEGQITQQPSGSQAIRCQAPVPSVAGLSSVPVAVSMDGHRFSTGGEIRFMYLDDFLVSSVSPTSGLSGGGTQLTITGSNFVPSIYITCLFGENSGQSRGQFLSSTQISCPSPTLAAGLSYPLSVSLNADRAHACPNTDPIMNCPITVPIVFRSFGRPDALRVVPSFAKVGGGTVVTVFGRQLLKKKDVEGEEEGSAS